jgi:hypothetical protein
MAVEYQIVQTLTLPTTSSSGITSQSLEAGGQYRIWVEGVAIFHKYSDNNFFDPEFAYDKSMGVWTEDFNTHFKIDPTSPNAYTSMDVEINNQELDWLNPNGLAHQVNLTSHKYYVDWIGEGAPLTFLVDDSHDWTDNSGAYTVMIYKAVPNVPDSGSTLLLCGIAGLGFVAATVGRRKLTIQT